MLDEKQAQEIKKKLLEQLSKLPQEQVGEIRKQIENATPEQLEQLISMQSRAQGAGGSECIFCQIIKGKVETIKIYEDQDIFAILDIFPATRGHLIVMPRNHYQFIQEIPDNVFNKLFMFIKKVSPIVVKETKAQGLNIHISQGFIAGQKVNHFAINLIPRFEKDGLNFEWQRQKIDKQEIEKIGEKIKEKAQKVVLGDIQKHIEKEKKKQKVKIEKEASSELKHIKKRIP